MATVLLTLAIGLAAGVMSGMFGVGGGIVLLPAFVLLLSLDQKTATGTSLASLVMPVALLSVIAYARAGHVHFRTAALVGAGIFVGSLIGARIALGTSDLVLRRGFAVLLVLTAVRLAFVKS